MNVEQPFLRSREKFYGVVQFGKKFNWRVAFADHSIHDFYFNSKRLSSDRSDWSVFSLIVLGPITKFNQVVKSFGIIITLVMHRSHKVAMNLFTFIVNKIIMTRN